MNFKNIYISYLINNKKKILINVLNTLANIFIKRKN